MAQDVTTEARVRARLAKALRELRDLWTDEGDVDEALLDESMVAINRMILELARGRIELRREAMPPKTLTVAQAIGANLRAIRNESGETATQAYVAECMQRLGFDWKRITVAEVESGKRRLSWEEAVGISILFATSVVELAGYPRGDVVLTDTTQLTAGQYWQLMAGNRDDPGLSIGPTGDVSAALLGVEEFSEDDWRPINNRRRR